MTDETPTCAGIDGTFLVVGTDYLTQREFATMFHPSRRRSDGRLVGRRTAFPRHISRANPQVVAFGNRWLVSWQTNISHDNPVVSTKALRRSRWDVTGSFASASVGDLMWRFRKTGRCSSPSRDRSPRRTPTLRAASCWPTVRFPNPAFTISDAPDKQLRPAATFDGENFLVAWQDKRNSEFHYDARTDIYGTRVSPDGEVLDFDASGFGGIAMTSTPQPERDAALITSGGTTLFATSTFNTARDVEAFRLGIAEINPGTAR